MLRYLLLFIICLSLHNIGKAQGPYESIFGQDSTQWVFMWSNLFGTVQDTLYTKKDTLVNGSIWKEIACANCAEQYAGGLLREDTTTGEVWYKALFDINEPGRDTSPVLVCDFSLQVGDSFDLNGAWISTTTSTTVATVDSIDSFNGRRRVFFDLDGMSVPFFLEGVGTTIGVFYKHDGIFASQDLLCLYKDGVLDYSSPFYNCSTILSPSTRTVKDISTQVYPNPFTSRLYLEGRDYELFEIINLQGQVIYQQIYQNTISLTHLPKGIYFLRLSKQGQRTFTQKIIKQ